MRDINDVLETIKKEQISKAMQDFRDRFEVGTGDDDDTCMSKKLTSVGCSLRYNISREKMYLNTRENRLRNFELPNKVEREERRTLNAVVVLMKQGYRPLSTETLEEFVVRCME